MDNQNLVEEFRFWELQLWQGTIQVRGEVQEDFLAESDGFAPTTKAGSQCTKTRPFPISPPKLLRKCLGKLVMNFFHKQTYAVHYRQVTNMVPGLSTTSSFSSLSTPTSPTSTQDIEGSRQDPASIECDSEERQVRGDPCRNPTNQAMSTWESQRTEVENSWQVRRAPLKEKKKNSKTWCGEMLMRTVKKLSLSLGPSASDSPENTKSESQKLPLSPLTVQQTSTGRAVMLVSSSNSSEMNNDDKWSSLVRRTGVHPI